MAAAILFVDGVDQDQLPQEYKLGQFRQKTIATISNTKTPTLFALVDQWTASSAIKNDFFAEKDG
jgi:hypothetical protein